MDFSKGFKNFIDRAKKQINERVKDDSPVKIGKNEAQFDESFFTFQLQGGPKHTELLVASARIRDGIRHHNHFITL